MKRIVLLCQNLSPIEIEEEKEKKMIEKEETIDRIDHKKDEH